MSTFKKKLLSCICSLALVMGLLPVNAFAEIGSLDPTKDQVHVTVSNNTYTTTAGAPWSGTLVDTYVTLSSDSTMMSVIKQAIEEKGYTQTGAENNYIETINTLSAFDGGSESGWMGTLNDWFTSEGFAAYTVANGKLKSGDEVAVMYTTNGYGEDLGQSWSNTDKTLKAISFSAGTLSTDFASGTKAYTLTVPAGTTSVVVTPTATNKRYQVRTSVDGIEYQRSAAVPVSDGTVINVKCGYADFAATDADGVETYTFTVAVESTPTPEPGQTVHVSTAADLPTTIAAADTYILDADITLDSNQQITTVAGILDGNGHTITLGGKPLADTVSGTIKNLIVKGSCDLGGNAGSICKTLTGSLVACGSTATLSDSSWSAVTFGGLAGETSGTIANCWFAGVDNAYGAYGIAGKLTAGEIKNCLFTVGSSAAAVNGGTVTSCEKVTTADLNTKATGIAKLNTGMAEDAALVWKAGETTPILAEPVNALLSSLQFASSSWDDVVYTMTPDFSEDVTAYTVTVPTTCSGFYAKATLAEGVEGALTASYTNTSSADTTATLTSGSAASLRRFIASGSTAGNVLTIKVGDEVAATVTVVRSLQLSSLTLTDAAGNAISTNPAFTAASNYVAPVYEYAATVIKGGDIVVKPVSATSTSTVTVNGQALVDGAATVTPAYDDQNKATITIAVTEGESTSTYTLTLNGVEIPFDGSGTTEDPYILATADDLVALSNLVQQGITFADTSFKMTADITLPENWVPLGQMKEGCTETDPNGNGTNLIANINVFSGSIDCENHTLTVPKGGLPLFGFVLGASVSNLKIYGEEIAGYGLVNNYHITGTTGSAIVIDNVTLLSGTKTLKAGFLGGYTSGGYTVEIKNSTIESGVTIGYDKQQSRIGSFAGSFSGTITNCTSAADVYGVDMVGGIAGARNNSMSTGTISGCTFSGTVTATGTYAGGISGAGYDGLGWGLASAPNAMWSTFTNNTMSGTVTGVSRVGGILGGEGAVYQCWSNGVGSISNNVVTGSVSGQTQVGTVIGFLAGLNKYTTIANNSYVYAVGQKSIGCIEWVDTEYENPTAVEGTTYLNSAIELPSYKAGTGIWDPSCFTVKNCQRTDDPLGANAEDLCKAYTYFEVGTSVEATQPVKVGDTITVNVIATANDGLAAMEGTLAYDSTQFELVSMTQGAGLSGEDVSFLPAEGAAEAHFSFYGNEASAKDGIVVATVTLKALKAADDAAITVTPGKAAVAGQSLEYSVLVDEPSTLDVLAADALLADVNNSGKVNIVDAQVVYDMAKGKYGEDYSGLTLPEGWTKATLLWAANVNNDDAIDAADAFAIQRYVHYETWE